MHRSFPLVLSPPHILPFFHSFGFTITLVGCIVGLSTRGGAEGVGRSTTHAVVYSAILILVLDAFLAVVLL